MYSLDWLNTIRAEELAIVREWLVPPLRVLEIGGGTGAQAVALTAAGFEVTSVDLPGSSYAGARLCPIVEYDGRRLPFADGTFEMIYSSNVLEHLLDLASMMAEFRRVLSPTGWCIHVLPTSTWRFWTTATHFPSLIRYAGRVSAGAWQSLQGRSILFRTAATATIVAVTLIHDFFPSRHGERGDCMSEISLFSHHAWRKCFEQNGFFVRRWRPAGLFYTGYGILGERLPIEARRRLARFLGSACNIYELRRADNPGLCAEPR